MSRVLVDANVLLDVLTDDPQWYEWSAAQLDACAARAGLCIDPIVYAEVSVGFERIGFPAASARPRQPHVAAPGLLHWRACCNRRHGAAHA